MSISSLQIVDDFIKGKTWLGDAPGHISLGYWGLTKNTIFLPKISWGFNMLTHIKMLQQGNI